MNRLVLLRHGPTSATEASAFPLDEGLTLAADDRRWTSVRRELGSPSRALRSSANRASATAAVLNLDAEIDEALNECDFGSWRGRSLSEIHKSDPESLSVWLRDPGSAPHGGESLVTMAKRVRAFLDRAAQFDGTTVAITHGGVIKVAIATVLDAPLASIWRIEVAPLSITEIEHFDEGWTLRRANWTAPTDEHA